MVIGSPRFTSADRAADGGLGGDVADHEAVGAAGETAVGDERHVVAEAAAHDGAGRRQHLAHAGAALRAFVADDHHVPGLDRAVEDRFERVLLAVEDERAAR